MTLRIRIRDWWRGWSDADLEEARRQITGKHGPGAIIYLSPRAMRAFRATMIVFPFAKWGN